jgi:hypothetical protein
VHHQEKEGMPLLMLIIKKYAIADAGCYPSSEIPSTIFRPISEIIELVPASTRKKLMPG